MLSLRNHLRGFAMSSLAAVVALALPTAGQAAGLSGTSCQPGAGGQQFGLWGDLNWYTLVPGGDFETTPASWSLLGGAAQVPGSEPLAVTGSVGSSSLGLPVGSSAVSPPACVNVSKPTVELFSRASTPGTSVTVSVVYQNGGGNTVVTRFATLTPGSSWQASGPLHMPTVSAPGQSGSSGYVQLQLTATGGSAQIDDAYIDPWAGW